ncbi:MAG: hypothetical protein K8I60_13955 [Anaerolineae bacterium]|nr:hypothetical protein [Anaerolineae bacterium]
MMQIINGLIPYHDADTENSFLAYHLRRVRWLGSVEAFTPASLTVVFVTVALAVVFYTLVINGYYSYERMNRSSTAIGLLFFTSVGLDALLDFATMIVTANAISGELTAGRWDLLRLTLLPAAVIVRVQHISGQLRAWRVAMAVAGARIAVILLTLFHIYLNWSFTGTPPWGYMKFSELMLLIVLLGVFCVIYLLEPFWRLRTLAALGILLSGYFLASLSNVLMRPLVVLAVWVSQGMIVFGLGWVVFQIGNQVVSSNVTGLFIITLACCLLAAIIYGYYRGLSRLCLRLAVRRVSRLEID